MMLSENVKTTAYKESDETRLASSIERAETRDGAMEVRSALEYAREIMRGFDPEILNAKFSKDREEYLLAHPDIPPETIAQADDLVTAGLANIEREEDGCLRWLNAKLGKLRSLFGILAATSTISAFAEGIDSFPVDKVPSGYSASASHDDSRTEDVDIRKRDARQRAFEDRAAEGRFENEQELLGFLREVADGYDGEMSALYGVDGGGRFRIYDVNVSSGKAYVNASSDAAKSMVKMPGVTVTDVHTHPRIGIESMGLGGNMPPSIGDIRTNARVKYMERFDDSIRDASAAFGRSAERQLVVTEKGVWQYETSDESVPFLREQNEAALEQAMSIIDPQEYHASVEDAEEYFRAIQSGDAFVFDRAVRRLMQKGVDVPGLRKSVAETVAAANGESSDSDRTVLVWDDWQKMVASAPPEKEAEVIVDFIRFCEERGIKMKYTPFEKSGVAVGGNVE